MNYLQPIILSGGSGTRLWPLSRSAHPKQFLPLIDSQSLFQTTIQRLQQIENEHPSKSLNLLSPIVVCNQDHRFLVAEQLRAIKQTASQIILEPIGRNTAPALTVAAFNAVKMQSDAVLVVMPADHAVKDTVEFRAKISQAVELANQEKVVTLGIIPTHPETGFGYIKRGEEITENAFILDRFVEKPDKTTAQSYLDEGDYFWNSGLFIVRADRWLNLIKQFRQDIFDACQKAIEKELIDIDFVRLDKTAFTQCPADSIDYAVMEKIVSQGDKAVVLPLDVGWSDVGSWSSLWDISEKDEQQNSLKGDVMMHQSTGNLVDAQSRMVACVGVHDLVIVETPDAILVANKAQSQDVKFITNHLKNQQRVECQFHRCVHRPWGRFEPIDEGKRFKVKRLTVNSGETLSLQMHHHRAEHWIVVSGTAKVTKGDDTFLLTENQSTYISLGTQHRLENPGTIPLEIIEVQSGSYLGEDDIIRFEDIYNRNSND